MPKFSEASKKRLATCHPDLQKIFNLVIKNVDCTVTEGYRSDEDQEEAYKKGNSTLRAGQSKHNQMPALAVDVVAYPIQWESSKRNYHFAGYVKGIADALGIKIRCGADWDGDNDLDDQTFNDLVHFELKK